MDPPTPARRGRPLVAVLVQSTVTSNTQVTGGFKLGPINASVSTSLAIAVMQSATTTIGNAISMSVPPGMTQFGDYGIFKQQTSGDYWSEHWCTQVEYAYITAYSVRGVGWKIWQA
jgi:hypothetical protein